MSPKTEGRPIHYIAWLIGERIVRGFATVIALAAVARHLAPARFGVLNFANAMVILMVPLAQLGLDTVLVRQLVRYPSRVGALLGTSFALRLLGGIVCAIAIVEGSHYSKVLGAAQPALGPMSLIAICQAGDVVECWYRSIVQSRVVVIIRGTVVVTGAITKLVFVAVGAGLVAFAWVYTFEAGAVVAGLMISSRVAKQRTPRWTFDLGLSIELLRMGWGFALASFLAALAFRVDQIAVTGCLGDAAAGVYYGALRLMEPAIYVATVTAASLFPTLAIADERAEFHFRLETVFGIMSALAWATAIGATIAGPWLVPLVLGDAYRSAWPVLAIQAWASLFYFTGMIRSNFLTLRQAPWTQTFTAGAALAVQIVLNYLLVPALGISGAAVSFLLTQIVSALVFPMVFPVLRPCLVPQARGLLAPWRPRKWREFLAITHG